MIASRISQSTNYNRLNIFLIHATIESIMYLDISNNRRENLFVMMSKQSYFFDRATIKFIAII